VIRSEAHLLDSFTLFAALAALFVGFYVGRANSSRPFNRYFFFLHFGYGAWLILALIAAHAEDQLGPVRVSSSLATLLFVPAGLLFDSLLNPDSSLTVRIVRLRFLFVASVVSATLPMTTAWANRGPGGWDFGPARAASVILVTAIGIWFSWSAWTALRAARRRHRVEAMILPVVLAQVAFITVLALAIGAASLRTICFTALLLVAFSLWSAVQMATARVFSLREVLVLVLTRGLALGLRAAAVTATIYLFQGENAYVVGLLCVAWVYPLGKLTDRMLASVSKKLEDHSEQDARARAMRASHAEWQRDSLDEEIVGALRVFFSAENAALVLGSISPRDPSSSRRASLQNEARRRGFVTFESLYRSAAPKDVTALASALEHEDLSLVVHLSQGSHEATAFVGNRNRIRVTTTQEVELAREILGHFLVGVARLDLMAKAIHHQRLAAIGHLASRLQHDGRNRLAVVLAGVELLAEGMEREMTQEHREFILHELEDFIESFNLSLDMARADRCSLVSVDVAPLIPEVSLIADRQLKRFKVTVVCAIEHGMFFAIADARLLKQVLLNLFRNSCQALNRSASRVISVTVRRDDEWLVVSVADTGPGVPAAIIEKMFTPFAASRPDGTGLGLPLCREAMEMMRGRIEYVTPPGEAGATFELWLPRDKKAAAIQDALTS